MDRVKPRMQNAKKKGRSNDLPFFEIYKQRFYLLENWKRFLAPGCPYFFLSFSLGSLVTSPAFFNEPLNSALNTISALVIPCLIAPACPLIPPPLTLTLMSNFPTFSVIYRFFVYNHLSCSGLHPYPGYRGLPLSCPIKSCFCHNYSFIFNALGC